MLLQRLSEYAGRLPSPPPALYGEVPVRYIIDLDPSGHLLNPRPTDTSDPASPSTRRGKRVVVPQIQRSVGIKPLLLADNAEYTLGLARPESKPGRVHDCHEAYMALLDRCYTETRDPSVGAVQAFLHDDPADALDLDDDFDRGAAIAFRVGLGPLVTDLPAVQAFWAATNDPDADPDKPAPVMQCLVCGERRPVLSRLQGKLKRVPGGQTSGTALISANAPAFESYGLDASLIAPTCASCGERFTRAANNLLASDTNRITVGGVAFLAWTRSDVGFNLLTYFDDPQPEQVRDLIAFVRTGRFNPEIDDTAFYATALSGSGGRVVVRDWIDTTVGQVRQHLARWFADQQIVDAYGQPAAPLNLYRLAVGTVREAKDLPPTTPRAMLYAAVTGIPLPKGLLYQAVRRNRAEQGMTYQRAALIKLVLRSHDGRTESVTTEDMMVQLNPANSSQAYQCGRLLAVLEETQRQALGKTTIVERFFGTASSAPASVFGRLLRGAQPHLSKLERDKRTVYGALQRSLEEVQSHLETFPRTLTLEDQGLFALGYYHQRAHNRAQAIAGAERRKAAQRGSQNDADDATDELAGDDMTTADDMQMMEG